MKKIYYYIIILILIIINTPKAYADCTEEEINSLKNEIDKIEITYKHLGEVTKDDGSKVYNEFLVTAKNIPENVYVHLYPMIDSDFIEEKDELKITLTSGEWYYNLYSGKCKYTIEEIKVKLPTFNIYSLDPLCEGIDSSEFKLCEKYYEYEVDRETFERRVKIYRKENGIDNKKSVVKKKKNIIKSIVDVLVRNYIYIVIIFSIIIIIYIIALISRRKLKRKILN